MIIRKKKVNEREYYYLEHSFKVKGKIKKKELYLGKEIPKNIEEIKTHFLEEMYKDKWSDKLNKIKKNFLKEFNEMPALGRKKYIENFMIKFTYNSNRIEGNTITLKETANLLEEGIAPRNKPITDIKEIEAHKKVFYHMLEYEKDLS